MVNGRKRLAEWLRRSQLNQREGARLLGFHWTVINKILSGQRTPGLATALTIERVTGIPVDVWLPTSVGQDDETVPEPVRKRVVVK